MPNIIRAIPVQLIRAILVVLFILGFGSLIGCGGGGGSPVAATPMPPTTATVTVTASPTRDQIAFVNQQVGNGVTREELFQILLDNNIAQREYFEQRLRELGLILSVAILPPTTTPVTVTVTVPITVTPMTMTPPPPLPITLRITPVMTVTMTRVNDWEIHTTMVAGTLNGEIRTTTRMTLRITTNVRTTTFATMTSPSGPAVSLGILPLMTMTNAVTLAPIITTTRMTAVGGITTTTAMTMAAISITTRITAFATMVITLTANAAAANEISYSPNMQQVVGAVMADGFNRGFAIGESGFAFSGRYDGDNRAAGFTYDFDTFALRTDYIRLPSKQDGEVWLDTYRFGILRPINDEARFFAGVDSYKNAILAIDINGDSQHRFGIAAGDGYAVKYEFRLNI